MHYEDGDIKVYFSSCKRLKLIASLRESMFRKNQSSRSASSPNMEEKTLLFFYLCWTPRKGRYTSSRYLKSLSLAEHIHQVLKPKIGTWAVADITKRRVKHHPIRHCLSRFFTNDDDLQCALSRALYSARLQRRFCEQQRKVITYRTVRMISRAGAQRTGSCHMEVRLGPECTTK